MTTIVGIDPGAAGAIAQISPMVGIWRMPKSDRALVDLLQMFDPATTRVYIERAQAMPQKAARDGSRRFETGTSMFSYGVGYGVIRGVLAARRLWYREVSPATWKADLGLRLPSDGRDSAVRRAESKAASIAKARELFPEAADQIGKSDGKAEAVLIAEWGRRKGVEQPRRDGANAVHGHRERGVCRAEARAPRHRG